MRWRRVLDCEWTERDGSPTHVLDIATRALAMDSTHPVFDNPRWLQGGIPPNRARIAAHLSDPSRAVDLCYSAVQPTTLVNAEGVGAVAEIRIFCAPSVRGVSRLTEVH